MNISVKLSHENGFTTSNKQDGFRMTQKLVKKQMCPGKSASSSLGREVSGNLCTVELLVPKGAVLKVGIGMVILYSGLHSVDKHVIGKA